MADPRFFEKAGAITLGDLAGLTGARLMEGADPDLTIDEAAPLELAGPSCVSFLEGKKHLAALAESRAAACFIPEDLTPETSAALLLAKDPKAAYAKALERLYRERSWAWDGSEGAVSPAAHVDPSARLGSGVTVHAGAVIGPEAEIGERTVIGPGAIIAARVAIGRDCEIGAGCILQCALLGDRIRLHPGVTVGQPGFGYAFSGGVHHPIPQLGRVVIQHDVEIGSGTTIDRGAADDTLIGEGTKIDNLVQIGHNCRIGRGCVIVAQVGLSGSTILEDFVVLGGQVGTAGHLTIGKGAQVAAQSGVPRDIPAGEIQGGYPAKPIAQWRREVAMLSRMVKSGRKKPTE